MHQASIQVQGPVFHDPFLLTLEAPGSRHGCRAAHLIQRVLALRVGLSIAGGAAGAAAICQTQEEPQTYQRQKPESGQPS